MYIDYNKILRCVDDPRIFRTCHKRVNYHKLSIPPLGTQYVSADGQKVTTITRPFLVYSDTNNVQNLTYAELCETYLLQEAPITVSGLVHRCTWGTVSGHFDSGTVWGTVYTCDEIQIHTKPQEYLVMHLPVGFETRYVPGDAVGHIDVAVKSVDAVTAYFLCPMLEDKPDIVHMTHIDTLQYYKTIICNVAEDVDYTIRKLTSL